MKKWMLLFGLFQAGDAASTLFATQVLHFQELNPLMAMALEAHPLAFLALKALGTALVLAIAHRNRHDKTVLRVVRASAVVMALVVLWNLVGVILHVA